MAIWKESNSNEKGAYPAPFSIIVINNTTGNQDSVQGHLAADQAESVVQAGIYPCC